MNRWISDIEFTVLMIAIKREIHVTSVKNLPYLIVQGYHGRLSDDQIAEIRHELYFNVVHSLLKHMKHRWEMLCAYLDGENRFTVTYSDNKEYLCFLLNEHYYPVYKYETQPHKEFRLDNKGIKSVV